MDSDYFSESFNDEAGGIVSDERGEEELPEEFPGETEDAEGAGEESESNLPVVPMADPGADEKARGRDLALFVRTYPGVRPEDVPKEVWDRARRGESLVTAYMRYESGRLRRENERLTRQARELGTERVNRLRSAGSQLGSGAGERRRDPFDAGWEDAF